MIQLSVSSLNKLVDASDEMVQVVRKRFIVHFGSGVPEETTDCVAGFMRDGGSIRAVRKHEPAVLRLVAPRNPGCGGSR